MQEITYIAPLFSITEALLAWESLDKKMSLMSPEAVGNEDPINLMLDQASEIFQCFHRATLLRKSTGFYRLLLVFTCRLPLSPWRCRVWEHAPFGIYQWLHVLMHRELNVEYIESSIREPFVASTASVDRVSPRGAWNPSPPTSRSPSFASFVALESGRFGP